MLLSLRFPGPGMELEVRIWSLELFLTFQKGVMNYMG